MKYFQFQVDGRRAGPVRQRWKEAAADAVASGHATWNDDKLSVTLDEQSAIARHNTEKEIPDGRKTR